MLTEEPTDSRMRDGSCPVFRAFSAVLLIAIVMVTHAGVASSFGSH
jgi:hypothetical protein